MELYNYYNEYSTYLTSINGNKKYLTYKNLRFLGIEENIHCYRFELENGDQILRMIDKQFVSYEPVNDDEECKYNIIIKN
jgi:hypothetical protein